MSWWVMLLAAMGLSLGLFMTGLPIFACFLLVNVIGVLWLMGTAGLGLFVNSILDTWTTEALVAIPLYVLLGELLFRTGGVRILYQALNQIVGAIPGRMFVVATGVAAFLGAISGSAMASVAMLGRFVYPLMIERGCNRKLTIGTILAGATLDPIIPPSVLAIILATLANLSIAEFLIAGIMPGLLLAASFAAYAMIRTILDPSLDGKRTPEEEKLHGAKDVALALARVAPLGFVIFLVLGLVMLGIAQPTEAAAAGIIGAALTSVLYGTFSVRMLVEACRGAAMTTAVIAVIISCSKLFSQLLAFTGATAGLVGFVASLDMNRWVVFLIMQAAVHVFCMFIDGLGLMLIVVPVYGALLPHFGFDPIWFWMFFLINLTLGGITPPLGYTMFVFKSVTPGTSLMEIYNASLPILAVATAVLVVIAIYPEIVTWLPNSMK